jgi:hypothetical protein
VHRLGNNTELLEHHRTMVRIVKKQRINCKIWYLICQTTSDNLGPQMRPKYVPLCSLDCPLS